MKCARNKFLDQFLDIVVGVDDRDEEEDVDDGDDGTSAQLKVYSVVTAIIRRFF